jgi:hypothetical protein
VLQPRPKVLEGYLSEAEAASELSVASATLRKWREKRVGPPYVKAEKRIYYPIVGIRTWLKSCEVKPVRNTRRRTAEQRTSI